MLIVSGEFCLYALRFRFLCLLARLTKLRKYCKLLGLKNAWSQGHTFETIAGPIAELREKYPSAGASAMRTYLWNSYDMRVSRYVTR
jgi:hypothetical protein